MFYSLVILLLIQIYTNTDDIVIIHVNDVHCGLNDTIGYDGYKLYRDELKRNYTNVITVDVGDHVQGGTLGAISDGSAIIKLMNKLDFDVAILGNHEFDYGLEQLYKLGGNITSKYICANFCYRQNKSTIFEPYKIIDAGQKKVGFIGVLTPLTLSKTYLSSILDENGEQVYDFLAGNNGKDFYDRIQKNIDKLRNEEKVDYVILLTHIGMATEKFTSEGLLANLKNVTAILDAHTHKIYNTTSKDKEGKEIHITQTGTKLVRVGLLILKSDGSIISQNIDEIPEPINKTNATQINRASKNRWVDKEISDFINSIWNDYREELNILIGHSNFDIIVKVETDEAVLLECRYRECTLGNLITDAVRDAGNAEITILNGGSIRNDMKKGNLTRGQVIDVLPWFSNIVQKQLTGQAIFDALEFGVSKLPAISGGFPQVSGITFDLDASINSSVVTDDNGMFLNVTGKRRVSNVKINGEDLNVTRIYNASLLEYIASGGDGYSMLAKFNVSNETLITDTDALCLYIENELNGEIPEKYKSYQGRINIYNRSSSSSLPDILLLGFDQYKFNDTSKSIEFLTHLRIHNNLTEIKNISLKTNIYYDDKLRFLEESEIEIDCNYQRKKSNDLYEFLCSRNVNKTFSKIKFINNYLKINGETKSFESLSTVKVTGENIQNQKNDIFSSETYILDNSYLLNEDTTTLIEGENKDNTDLSSNRTYLIFNDNNRIKNISCVIQKGNEENKYKIICNTRSTLNADLNLNNLVQIKDQNKSLLINFNDEGNSLLNSTGDSFTYFKTKKSSGGLSSGAITAIVISSVVALAITGALIFLFKSPSINNNNKVISSDSKTNINQ